MLFSKLTNMAGIGSAMHRMPVRAQKKPIIRPNNVTGWETAIQSLVFKFEEKNCFAKKSFCIQQKSFAKKPLCMGFDEISLYMSPYPTVVIVTIHHQ